MKPWLVGLLALGAGIGAGAAAAVAVRGRGLAGARNVPDRDRRILGSELDEAERRARAAGATGEDLDYVGAGAEGVVFCDDKGLAYKVGREGSRIHDEATFLRKASQIASIKQHIPRHIRYDARNRVLVRECLVPTGARKPRKLWELHDRIARTMKPYGHGRPEFKDDSYVMTRRGPVLVDAGFAIKHGHELVKDVLDAVNGRVQLKPIDIRQLAWDVRHERGKEIPAPVADRLLTRLTALEPSIAND